MGNVDEYAACLYLYVCLVDDEVVEAVCKRTKKIADLVLLLSCLSGQRLNECAAGPGIRPFRLQDQARVDVECAADPGTMKLV